MPAPAAASLSVKRRYPVGAEIVDGRVHFRVWAPKRERVDVVLHGREGRPDSVAALAREADGYFSGFVAKARIGGDYRLRLDGAGLYPDPASRFQPEGPFGPSRVVDPSAFAWTDAAWKGPERNGQVIYELHVGTFTREGTFDAASKELPGLADLGVTMLEVMPVGDFPGRFGWGYDGVNIFAPTRLYGDPDDFRAFVDRAHGLGLAVILDVVYNHFGSSGMFWHEFSDTYFSRRYTNDWGEALNFDDRNAGPVREFFLSNAAYWVEEFHLDGLRLDATQQIHDGSVPHILLELSRTVRAAGGRRRTYIVTENEPQDSGLVRAEAQGGCGLDAMWNDDFHHTAMVALTGRREAYYTDYRGTPQELISAARWGFLYQGQRYAWQDQPRGTPSLDLPATAFVAFLQNHDQIANNARSARCHTEASPGRMRALTALLLLMPATPMLFQGQEFQSSAPFHYFADHDPELNRAVREGRGAFLNQFRRQALPEIQTGRPDPADPKTFARSKLDPRERSANAHVLALHRDLLALRRSDPRFSAQRSDLLHGAVLGPETFLLRFLDPAAEAADDRLLIVNLGRDLHLFTAPEPLLAPPSRGGWTLCWSSESPRYGGTGTPAVYTPNTGDNWRIPADSAVVLKPETQSETAT